MGSSHLIDSITQHQAFGGLQTEATRSIERRLTFTTVVCIASDEHAFVAQTDDNNTENRSLQHSFNSYIQRTTKTTPAKPFPPPPPLLLLLILLLAVPLLLQLSWVGQSEFNSHINYCNWSCGARLFTAGCHSTESKQ